MMGTTPMKKLAVPLLIAAALGGCAQNRAPASTGAQKHPTPAQRMAQRDFPSAYQAWNPLDMPGRFPQDTIEQRIAAAAKHDLLWEEPVSQIGFKTPLVLGLEWAGKHAGESTSWDPASLAQAKKNRAALLKINPAMITLMEIRWRDAPGSYLPENSPWWLRNPDGSRVLGWDNGPEPYYMLNYDHPGFIAHVGEQARIAVESGVYDGVMLDWSGHLPMVESVRKAIGEDAIIIVNIHDDIHDGEKYAHLINGAFMECDPEPGKLCGWEKMGRALRYYESAFRSPRVNALEGWGDRKDLKRMRAVTTLGLTQSDAYVLYGDPNPLKTPDHLHDWYDFWDARLGKPLAVGSEQADKTWRREFSGGTVVYNPYGNARINVTFAARRTRASDGSTGTTFAVDPADGDIFLN
jgi:uncharacterized protein YceK